MAQAMLDVLAARRARVPAQCSLVADSATRTPMAACGRLSAMEQPLEAIGAEAVRLLAELIDADRSSLPGRYLPARFFAGDTTTARENRLFEEIEREQGIASPAGAV